MDHLPEGTHYRRATTRKGGIPVRGTIVHNRGRRGKRTLAVAATAALTIGVPAGFVASASLTSSASGDSLTVQIKADLNQAIAELGGLLGLPSTHAVKSSSSSYGTDCAKTATRDVKQFLHRHPCKEYASAILTIRRQGTMAQVAIAWVVMPTGALATGYKAKADESGRGNPPGEPSPPFNGLCYASGQDGATVWAEQVRPTGRKRADQEILQAAAPGKLTEDYLQRHCVH